MIDSALTKNLLQRRREAKVTLIRLVTRLVPEKESFIFIEKEFKVYFYILIVLRLLNMDFLFPYSETKLKPHLKV